MSWSLTFSQIKFDNVDEFLWVNISYERVVIVFVMDTVTGWVKWCEYVWIGLYKLVDFPEICVIEIVTLDPKVPLTDSAKRFAFSALVLAVLLSSVSVA